MRVVGVVLAVTLLISASLAQLADIDPVQSDSSAPVIARSLGENTPKAERAKEAAVRHQAALTMLDLVVGGVQSLTLPQNRITIASTAFPILWTHKQPQARSLVPQLIGDFAQAASRQQEDSDVNDRSMLHQQWEAVVRAIAPCDAGLALHFMDATRQFVQMGDAEQQEAEERNLRLEIASQDAQRNPQNALRMAESELKAGGDLPMQLLNLLTDVAAKDPEAGSQLLHEIVSQLRSSKLSSGLNNFNLAVSLLNTQANSSGEGSRPDESLKGLAEAVASVALSPEFPANNLVVLQGSMPVFEQLVPDRADRLRQRVHEFFRMQNPGQDVWDQFNNAQESGDPNKLLAIAERAPVDIRSNMYQQAAWTFANNGDLQRVQQVAEKLQDPFQREQILRRAVQQSAWIAANQGQFPAARQLAEEVTPDENRAILLAQLASSAAASRQEAFAAEMLDEAGALLLNRNRGSVTFGAQLQVAQVFAHVMPARAVPLLERSSSQLEQVLAAAVEVDGFLPYQHSFEGGELILNNSFLWSSLIGPYAEAVSQLASTDLPTARILVDRLSLPEARLLAELFVARSALADGDANGTDQAVSGGPFSLSSRY